VITPEFHILAKNVLAPLPLSTIEGMQLLLGWMSQTDPRAKGAKAEQFIDSTNLRDRKERLRFQFVQGIKEKRSSALLRTHNFTIVSDRDRIGCLTL